MRDVLVIIPSRGRPHRLGKALEATLALATRTTHIAVAWDDDDPQGRGYDQLMSDYAGNHRVLWYKGPRQSLTEWTNQIASYYLDGYWCVASHGDDHLPKTPDWDNMLVGSIARLGGTGITYANDLHQGAHLPTSVMISTDIVKALGWFAMPATKHYYIDNVWKDLGEGAGCLAYRQDVHIEHLHPNWQNAPNDQTYTDAINARWNADGEAYDAWCRHQRDTDIKTVKACLPTPAS